MTEPGDHRFGPETNRAKVLVDLDKVVAPVYVNSCWFAMRDFAQKNPELIRRFQNAIYAAQKWANGHHAESGAILAKYSKMDPDLVRRMGRAPWADGLRVAEIRRSSTSEQSTASSTTSFRREPHLPARIITTDDHHHDRPESHRRVLRTGRIPHRRPRKSQRRDALFRRLPAGESPVGGVRYEPVRARQDPDDRHGRSQSRWASRPCSRQPISVPANARAECSSTIRSSPTTGRS